MTIDVAWRRRAARRICSNGCGGQSGTASASSRAFPTSFARCSAALGMASDLARTNLGWVALEIIVNALETSLAGLSMEPFLFLRFGCHCHRARAILPHARANLLAQFGRVAPRRVFVDIVDRIPRVALEAMQDAQRQVEKKYRKVCRDNPYGRWPEELGVAIAGVC